MSKRTVFKDPDMYGIQVKGATSKFKLLVWRKGVQGGNTNSVIFLILLTLKRKIMESKF